MLLAPAPAGISAAYALTKAGRPVTLIEPGLSLEPENRAVVDRLAEKPKAEWLQADVQAFREGTMPTSSGVMLKHVQGSDFPYRDAERRMAMRRENVELLPSLHRVD